MNGLTFILLIAVVAMSSPQVARSNELVSHQQSPAAEDHINLGDDPSEVANNEEGAELPENEDLSRTDLGLRNRLIGAASRAREGVSGASESAMSSFSDYYARGRYWTSDTFNSLWTDTELLDSWVDALRHSAADGWTYVADSSTLTMVQGGELFSGSREWLGDYFAAAPEATVEFSRGIYDFAATGSQFAITKSSSGALSFYERTADGAAKLVDWSDRKYQDIVQIDVCEIDVIDTAGGFATGVAITSAAAGVNVMGAGLMMIPTISGWVPAIAIATSPAIPVGVSLAAGAGVVLYASTKGYCWWRGDVSQSNEDYELAPEFIAAD